MSAEYSTLTEVAGVFRCERRKIAKLARENRIGLQLGGRAGWRFTEADVRQIADLMRPKPQARRDKRKRVA